MTLHPLLSQLLMPNRRAVIFALKGVVSMALALIVAMYLQLDRPYWALVSAVFADSTGKRAGYRESSLPDFWLDSGWWGRDSDPGFVYAISFAGAGLSYALDWFECRRLFHGA